MASGRLAFKETDIARAMRAAHRAAVGAWYVRIDRLTGDILILPGADIPAQAAAPAPAGRSPTEEDLDREMAEWEASHEG